MRRLAYFVLFLTVGFTANAQVDAGEVKYGYPTEYEIGGIRVEGTKYLDGNSLISLTGLKVGDRIKVPGDDISKAIKKLWKHGLVADASIYQEKIEGGKIFLVILLKERPRMSKFEFTGIPKSQKTDLSEALALHRGKVLTDATLKNTETTVKQHFIDKGFLNIEVKIDQVPDTILANHVRLHIKVDRKAKVKIDRINIQGADLIAEQKMKKKIKNTKAEISLPALIFEISRISSINASKVWPDVRMALIYLACTLSSEVVVSKSLIPMMPLRGVRNSWLILATKLDLAWLALSATLIA